MKNNNVIRSIGICLKSNLSDCLLLIGISLLLSAFPMIIMLNYNFMLSAISQRVTLPLFLSIMIVFGYAGLLFLQKIIYDGYNHYYLNYRSLLKFEKNIKQYFFDICTKLNLEDYHDPKIVNETRMAQNASINIFRLFQIIVEIISALIGIILVGGIIIRIEKQLLLFFVLTTIPPVADNVLKVFQKKHLLYTNTQAHKEEEEYMGLLTRHSSLKEIKVLQCFDFIFAKWLHVRQSIMKVERDANTKIFVLSLTMDLIKLCGTVGAYLVITTLYINQQIDLPEFSLSIITFTQINGIFNRIFSLFGDYSQFVVMVKPFFSFLDNPVSSPKIECLESDNVQLRIKNLSYKYPNSDVYALFNINVNIKKGAFVSVVGENGSGKSTFVKILLGLLLPTEGTLQINTAVNDEESYLHKTSYVPQSFNCYNISVKDNVVFGSEVSEVYLAKLFAVGGLENLVSNMDTPYGLEFGGIELSGGQKQKIAIARALFKEAEFLIFDEATSAVDPLQESQVYQRLLDISRGKTTIMISHRLALTKQSSLIIVLKNGEIKELGCHEELMRLKGEYFAMWSSQANLYLS